MVRLGYYGHYLLSTLKTTVFSAVTMFQSRTRLFPFERLPDLRSLSGLQLEETHNAFACRRARVRYAHLHSGLVARQGLVLRQDLRKRGKGFGPPVRNLEPTPSAVWWTTDVCWLRGEGKDSITTFGFAEVRGARCYVCLPPVFGGLNPQEVRRTMTPRLRFAVLARDNFRCVACGAAAPESVLHVDHILPVVRGGQNTLDNLQTLCQLCNSGKGAVNWP